MSLLYLTILLPLIGFVLLAFSRGRWSENTSATIGIGSVFIAALIGLYAGINFFAHSEQAFDLPMWTWIHEGAFNIGITLHLDGLSLTMLGVVTGVGTLIHLFASWYMRGEEGYSRFFAYTNLFIASMLVLVLADNLLVLYLGWEGVGLCSYLLIGFYYGNPANGAAAMKAFIVTRVGDVFLAIALFILYAQFGTLNIAELSQIAPAKVAVGSSVMFWATLMLLGGAVGKSAQLPLQTWLADAMAGPTPVSALIHAATMVTAGVYLIARTHVLFLMAPQVLHLVGIIGAITLVIAGFSALVQTDIKRVLAYSTMSQIGYMFLALGVQAWDAAIFHLMIHAFFKALLFLASGSVILSCHHEQNIFKMGGLRKQLPLAFAAFIVGGGALSALPLLTAGFYSKDEILSGAFASGHINLLTAGLVGALLTALYTFRMIFIVFFGKSHVQAHPGKGFAHNLPLIILMILSTFIGALIPQPLRDALPHSFAGDSLTVQLISGSAAIIGLVLAAWIWLGNRQWVESLSNHYLCRLVSRYWFNAWGFDWLYDKVFVQPYLKIARLLRADPINAMVDSSRYLALGGNWTLTLTENGKVRWYIASMGIGAVCVLGLLLLS
ncbi:NADH-quinone oxidoreductase subunit L [Celerinatantimonas diazotrophica]|uniref:NADH-quinone oxidoreductase subunit L n=1 Tax=Celerinatantimonas diazotrophica TaxID=412034 RepID=A0A4R1JLH9_9GAMM|nr:NADH-quinone oxidoreductase subunit L [Celerinatantimonas diazotrophica]TCK51847.1 NADH dehydrogenase subunit L [Celerinatantimonas diazotrophica]CAG9296460.1 NADH-quinone oxidoreductase subunit L [Celerinatantimonas diazotrophica]